MDVTFRKFQLGSLVQDAQNAAMILCPEAYDLDAPYQRGLVWTVAQKRRLIASVLMGLPVGAIYRRHLGFQSEASWRIIDGKQRISAIREFVADGFTVPAEWFSAEGEGDAQCGETLFSGLSKMAQRRLLGGNSCFMVYDVTLATDEDERVLFDLLNGGGTAQADGAVRPLAEV